MTRVDGAVTPVQTAGPAPGSAFPVGVTTITYTATDAAGNAASASFTVTVTLRGAAPSLSGIEASPTTILANGSDTSQITVSVRDDTGTLLGRGGMTVVLTTSLATLGPVEDLGDGRYRATLFAGTLSGTAVISGTVDSQPIGGSASIRLEPDRAVIAETFTQTTRAFIQRRIDRILASEPRLHHPDRRREAGTGVRFALTADGQGSDIAGRFHVSGMLGELPAGGLDITSIDSGVPARNLSFSLQSISPDMRWHVWAEGQYARHQDETGPLGRRSGEFGILHFGGDYLLNERLTLGMMGTIDHLAERIPGVSHVSGLGWMLGPYASAEVVEGVFLTARAAWGHSRNTARIDVYGNGNIWSGDFATRRALARVTVSGRHETDRLVLRPQLDLSWMEERQLNYAVTDGIATVDVDGIRSSIGRLSFSGEAEWPVMIAGHEARAFVIPTVSWDFAGTGQLAGHQRAGGSLELGLRTSEQQGWRGEASVRADGLGQADFRGVTFRMNIDRRF